MRIPAIRVNQWLSEWDAYQYDDRVRQRKPEPFFYICSISAPLLRRLSGVRRRHPEGPRSSDIGIQRGHDKRRSSEILEYVKAGHPWATLGNRDKQEQHLDLKKPGWLPTALVANLVSDTTSRDGRRANPRDLITIEETGTNTVDLIFPDGSEKPTWEPTPLHLEPIEIIDGQHRLYAFEGDEELTGQFELPVVLFVDLDISWQAYLFWTINIKPKRISPSMAYDLYPLLRTFEWLEQGEGTLTYRETRAQELTEALWSHPSSPWRARIGMLGRERGKVTQAAFVRSLTLSFVRGWAGGQSSILGGLFGTARSGQEADVLQWNRAQQAAYLISLWSSLENAIADSDNEWAKFLRQHTPPTDEAAGHDAAFAGRYSILASDQGVRGFLQVCNDISYHSRSAIGFSKWRRQRSAEATDQEEVTDALADLAEQDQIFTFIQSLTTEISRFDWRSAVTPNLPTNAEIFQSRYRGGSGYRQVRQQLLLHLSQSTDTTIGAAARSVAAILRYD